jgi:hypothetical protein
MRKAYDLTIRICYNKNDLKLDKMDGNKNITITKFDLKDPLLIHIFSNSEQIEMSYPISLDLTCGVPITQYAKYWNMRTSDIDDISLKNESKEHLRKLNRFEYSDFHPLINLSIIKQMIKPPNTKNWKENYKRSFIENYYSTINKQICMLIKVGPRIENRIEMIAYMDKLNREFYEYLESQKVLDGAFKNYISNMLVQLHKNVIKDVGKDRFMRTLCTFFGITDINEKSTENKDYFSTTIKLFEVEDSNRFSDWVYKVVAYENTFLCENNI